MQQHFVEYPLAQKLKEAGFKQKCLRYWHFAEACMYIPENHPFIEDVEFVPLPIYQQVFDWLETKMLFVKWWCNYKTGMCTVRITNEKDYILWMGKDGEQPKVYPSKKAAWDAGIEQALELLKDRQ